MLMPNKTETPLQIKETSERKRRKRAGERTPNACLSKSGGVISDGKTDHYPAAILGEQVSTKRMLDVP